MSRQDPWGARPQGTAWTISERPREGHATLMTLDNGSCSGKSGPVGPEERWAERVLSLVPRPQPVKASLTRCRRHFPGVGSGRTRHGACAVDAPERPRASGWDMQDREPQSPARASLSAATAGTRAAPGQAGANWWV